MSLKNNYVTEIQNKIENRIQPLLKFIPNFISPNMLSLGNFIGITIGSTFLYFQMYVH